MIVESCKRWQINGNDDDDELKYLVIGSSYYIVCRGYCMYWNIFFRNLNKYKDKND